MVSANSMVGDKSVLIIGEGDGLYQQAITGTIVDMQGVPVPGATVLEKGTTNGVAADFDGNYTITVSSANAVLVFRSIGFATQEIPVGTQNSINVTLEEDAQSLQEVVVTGYGGVQRNEFVGATSVARAETLEQQPITTVEQGIQGRMAGVQVLQSSGAPGAGVSVRVRGISSFAGGNEPLYVIDGIPIFNDDVRGLNGISSLNPNDIESVEVLKDAASTAIYGSRAANGVVQITTKGGRGSGLDGVRVNYHVYTALQNVRKRYDLMDGQEFIDYATTFFQNSTDLYTEEEIDGILGELVTVGNAETDWQDQVYRTGFQQSHALSVTGGDSDNNYYISGNYVDQQGIVKATDFERYAFRVNLKNTLSEKLTLDSRASFSQSIQNGFVSSDGTNNRNNGKSGMASVFLAAPTVPVYGSDGAFSVVNPYSFNGPTVENPMAMLDVLDRNKISRLQGVLSLNYKITENLTNVSRLSVDYIDRKSDFYSPSYLPQLGSQNAQLQTRNSLNTLAEDYINYKNTFGKIGVDVLAGMSIQKEKSNTISLSGTGFPSDGLKNNAFQAATVLGTPNTNVVEQALFSVFGRMQFDYEKKYLLSLNARRDGSSVFSDGNKYANFGAIGAAWRISEEDFMQDGIFNDLKIRASTGTLGNQAIRPYQSLRVGSIVQTGQGAGSGLNVGLAPNLPNPNLTWETTTQSNVGIDAGISNNSFRFSFDYYVKTTNDLLARVALPQSSGFTSIIDNVGKVENKGFEIMASADIVNTENFTFTLEGQFSRNRNLVLETKDGQDIISGGNNDDSGSTSIVRPGESLFSFYTIKFLGHDEITGAPIYEDLNDDGIINADDRQVLGSPLPDFTYGFNTTMKYKRFSFLTNWQGVEGASVNNRGLADAAAPFPQFNRAGSTRDFWPIPRDGFQIENSDMFIEDASYLRLANIRLGYDLNPEFLGLDGVNIYVSAQNLITITNYSGFDPEVNSLSGNDLRQGVDLAAYPTAKTFTLGLNINF
jgi:TonB-linked SusC/RagA family outer membrane protein